jgi:hypothetical protein
MKEIDEELKGGQKKLDVAEPKGKITKADFEKLRNMNEMDADQIRPDLKSAYDQGYKAGYAKCKYEMTGEFPDIFESEDHEVSMAHSSLKSIVSSASQLMNLLGQEEKNIPAWIQDHITNAENYINQAAKNYHDYSHEQEPEDDEMSLQAMMEDLLEAKKKPSAGLSKKQKSAIVKKAKAGKDIGKKGKGFEKVMKAAEKGGAENPQAVAAAAMWKSAAKKAK